MAKLISHVYSTRCWGGKILSSFDFIMGIGTLPPSRTQGKFQFNKNGVQMLSSPRQDKTKLCYLIWYIYWSVSGNCVFVECSMHRQSSQWAVRCTIIKCVCYSYETSFNISDNRNFWKTYYTSFYCSCAFSTFRKGLQYL